MKRLTDSFAFYAFCVVLIAALIVVGCTPQPTATPLPSTVTSAAATDTTTPPTETPIIPTDFPTEVAAPSLPPNIELSPTPEGFDPTVEPSSTPLTRQGVLGIAAGAGLHIQGVTVVDNSDKRFVFAGINFEMYRDYGNGCGWVTDGTYNIRGIMADRVKALGVNAVRLNYSYRFLTGSYSANLSRYLDMAQELAQRGLYVMPSDHTYTGGVLSGASASYPTMKAIIDGFKARGIESYLIFNPFNEPGPDISVSQWVTAQKAVLTYLRNTAAFNGIVALDGTGWATMLDTNAFKQVMDFDNTLRGNAGANVMFSHHLYPNIPSLPAQLWTAAKTVPLIIGELGQENPGSSPLDPQYVKNVINGFLNTGNAAGHNGLWGWIWTWCDVNGMLDDWTDPSVPYTTKSPLNAHGVLWRDFYYSKLAGTPVSTPLPVSSLTPTNTRTVAPPTATRTTTRSPVPTDTPTPLISLTPSVTPSPTVTPTPTNRPRLVVTGEFGGTPFSAIIEQQ